jgi:hypothetical protein
MTDTTELVARLRDQWDMIQLGEDAYEAADTIERLTRERDEARVAALEEAAAAVEQKAKAVCRQECCGYGVGSPPECCGDAILMVSDSEAVDAIRALKEPRISFPYQMKDTTQ